MFPVGNSAPRAALVNPNEATPRIEGRLKVEIETKYDSTRLSVIRNERWLSPPCPSKSSANWFSHFAVDAGTGPRTLPAITAAIMVTTRTGTGITTIYARSRWSLIFTLVIFQSKEFV